MYIYVHIYVYVYMHTHMYMCVFHHIGRAIGRSLAMLELSMFEVQFIPAEEYTWSIKWNEVIIASNFPNKCFDIKLFISDIKTKTTKPSKAKDFLFLCHLGCRLITKRSQ